MNQNEKLELQIFPGNFYEADRMNGKWKSL